MLALEEPRYTGLNGSGKIAQSGSLRRKHSGSPNHKHDNSSYSYIKILIKHLVSY